MFEAIERHGRSEWDAIRPGIFLYGVHSGPGSSLHPEPVLNIAVAGRTVKVQRRDFSAVTRTSSEGPTGKSGSARSYAGIWMSHLLTPSDVAGVDTYEIRYGFFRRRRLRRSDLEPGSDLLIADMVDQHPVGRARLFYVVVTARGGRMITIDKVYAIVLR